VQEDKKWPSFWELSATKMKEYAGCSGTVDHLDSQMDADSKRRMADEDLQRGEYRYQ
jgi:hypothetical protein